MLTGLILNIVSKFEILFQAVYFPHGIY